MTQDMDYLHVLDSRTEKSYKIPIQDNFIQATDVGKITLPDASHEEKNTSVENARPLRLLDQGFENTACMVSSITVMYAVYNPPHTTLLLTFLQSDGHHGEFRFRGLPIEDLFRTYIYEDVMHLLIWEALPSPKQKEDVRTALCQAAIPPETVVNVISAFPFVTPKQSQYNSFEGLTRVAQARFGDLQHDLSRHERFCLLGQHHGCYPPPTKTHVPRQSRKG